MSGSMNKVILVGNLGVDPEVRQMNNGDSVCNLRVATSESWKDKATGDRKSKTEWHTVVVFGKSADICGQYLRKGSKVLVEGQIETRKWSDQSGNDRYSTEVVVRMGGNVTFLDPAGNKSSDAGPVSDGGGSGLDDDIPF